MTRNTIKGILALLLYVATIVGANVAIKSIGIVSVGFGLMAPAAVYFVAAALVARDGVQWWLGKKAALAAIVVGVALSAWLAGAELAFASGAAFAASELVDFGFFTAITYKKPRWLEGELVAGLLAAVVDSLIFLSLAFHSYAFLPGQLVGKATGILVATLLLTPWRLRRVAFAV